MILKTEEEVLSYIENLRTEIVLRRLEIDREKVKDTQHDRSYCLEMKSAELILSNYYSDRTGLKKESYDQYVITMKEESLLDLIKNYPKGIKINDVGGCFPIT